MRLFDWLFWLYMGLTILYRLLNATTYSNEMSLTNSISHAVMQIGGAGALWYFASIRRSIFPLFFIISVVASKVLIFYSVLPDVAWFSQTWLLINIGPELLLVVAVSAMMTSSARSWRRREGEHLSDVFE